MPGLLSLVRKYPDLRRGLTLEVLLNKANFIKPRYFTIASSSTMHPKQLHIGISLNEDKLPSGAAKMGQTSAYFERIAKMDGAMPKVRLFTKESNFVMCPDPKTPIVMVGAGTGVVPFIGFMQERQLQKEAGKELGEAHLYFGCKYRDVDFIYRDEMTSQHDNKVISDLHLAFSREDPKKKLYVQNLVTQQAESLRRMLGEQKGVFYICGSNAMGKSVQTELKNILGDDVYAEVEKEKRLIKELW